MTLIAMEALASLTTPAAGSQPDADPGAFAEILAAVLMPGVAVPPTPSERHPATDRVDDAAPHGEAARVTPTVEAAAVIAQALSSSPVRQALSSSPVRQALSSSPPAGVAALAGPGDFPMDAVPMDAVPMDADPMDAVPMDAVPMDADQAADVPADHAPAHLPEAPPAGPGSTASSPPPDAPPEPPGAGATPAAATPAAATPAGNVGRPPAPPQPPSAVEARRAVDRPPGPAPVSATAGQAAEPSSAPLPDAVATGSADAPREPTSVAVQRVADIVRRLADAPPPRQVVVDLPEADGLRMLVQLRGEGVHLTVLDDPRGTAAALLREAAAVLGARGLDMEASRDGRGSPREHPEQDHERRDAPPRGAAREKHDPRLRL